MGMSNYSKAYHGTEHCIESGGVCSHAYMIHAFVTMQGQAHNVCMDLTFS